MKKLLPLLWLFFTPFAIGGNLVVTTHHGSPPVVSHLIVKADYVVVPVTISSDEDEPDDRINSIQRTRDLVASSLRSKGFKLEPGIVSVSPRQRDSFSFKSYPRDSGVKLYVLGEISNDGSVFAQVIKMHQALKDLEKPRDVEIRPGSTSLGIEDPEKYRQQLLQMISDQVAEDMKSLGMSGSVEITGLENPVSIIQKDDSQVGLYLDYGFRITQ